MKPDIDRSRYLFGVSPRPMNGTAPPPVTCGRIPFHLSIALILASIFLSSIRSVEIFALCSLKDSASALAAVIFCSASIFILSRSLFAFSASCSAVCFDSMASMNILEKLNPTIENASTDMLWTKSLSVRSSFIASLTAGHYVIVDRDRGAYILEIGRGGRSTRLFLLHLDIPPDNFLHYRYPDMQPFVKHVLLNSAKIKDNPSFPRPNLNPWI